MLDLSEFSNGGLVPESFQGKNVELEEHVVKESIQAAESLFRTASEGLLNPDTWQGTAGGSGAAFALWNDQNKGLIENHSIIRINIPGPGSPNGNGFDWVKVEKISKHKNNSSHKASVGILLRPIPDPTTPDNDNAHFFAPGASSTLILQWHYNIVLAAYFGRNEKPNIHTKSTVTNIRNSVVAAGAILGMSEIQWSALLKGFLTM